MHASDTPNVGTATAATATTPTAPTTTTTTPFTCQTCGETCASRNKLFQHLRSAHPPPAADTHTNGDDDTTAAPTVCLDRFESVLGGFTSFLTARPRPPLVVAAEDPSSYRVVVKPQGVPTTIQGRNAAEMPHPALVTFPDLFVVPDAVARNLKYKKCVPCHRLDSATGGLVICSKTRQDEAVLKALFFHRQVSKRYRAVVSGRLEPREGTIDRPLKGKPSVTRYAVATYTASARYGTLSTVDLYPVTGRRHQLRKHLQLVGHPILGDVRYAHARLWPERIGGEVRLFLWAVFVEFPHPRSAFALSLLGKGRVVSSSSGSGRESVAGGAGAKRPRQDEEGEPGGDEDDNDGVDDGDGDGVNALDDDEDGGDATPLVRPADTPVVTVEIDEPAFFEAFRECHRREHADRSSTKEPDKNPEGLENSLGRVSS